MAATGDRLPPKVDVWVQIDGRDVLAGQLNSHYGRGAESATFLYDPGYLADPLAYDLEPALPRVAGALHTAVGVSLFHSFADSSPDRWGKVLITKAERQRARTAGATPRTLSEFSYLLGVRDDLRQGAVRFALSGTRTFLADDVTGVPALAELPDLLNLAERTEDDDADLEAIRKLVRAGSSLGGARPKAHVRTEDGAIAIAKFPSRSDAWNVMAWEKIAFDLASAAGIAVPRSQLLKVAGRHVHVIDRFDRAGRLRIGYISAMTMLEAKDGDTGSYLDIASAIEEHSIATSRELRDLWRRIVFSILISNLDDHLRNHGFLRTTHNAWSLSPAFDLNPDPSPGAKYLSTAINDRDTDASLELALDVAEMFRLSQTEAREVVAEVARATARWSEVAARYGQTTQQIDDMSPAFEHSEAHAARHQAS
ncbi:HipA domain protein [Kribbella flavida DSM 17836]|uniref:HipA domain protein n=1 Tax=Kribbella flavida (strain DSM 17836 / JCM 10339 / NBRC 14399) TaxID=479435 RepID=D2PY84_KRIFD|nr:HipA domain-containing protein [Kribbella flavida]ADB35452.1 HipA domain protein [Kribbella flavida DSM 17836]